MSVRKLKKSYISCVGYFKSYKTNKQHSFDSILERDFFTILEFDENVVNYAEQPFRMYYQLNGAKTRYTPDVLVTYQDDSQKLFEVKYQSDIDSDEELQYKLSVLPDEIQKQKDLVFEVITDEKLYGTYFDNCTFLYSFAFLHLDESLVQSVHEQIYNLDTEFSIRQLLNSLTQDSTLQLKLIPCIWQIIFKDNLLVDMYKKLTMVTIISLRRTS